MKNNILKLFLLSFTLVLLGNNAYGQDPAFSQFYSNPLYLNPAFAGANNNGCPTTNLNYRDQWPGIGRTYITYSASYDQHVDALGGGIGILVHQDQAGNGNLNTLNASLIYSYLLEVNRDLTFKVGFETSLKSLSLDWGNLTFGDQIDPTYGFIYTTQEQIVNNPNHVSYPDFSTGFLGYTEKMYFGFSAHHLTQPNQGFISVSHLPTKYTAHIGGKWPLSQYKNDIITISPNFLYQQQQEFQQFNYGVYINRGPIVGGLWARNSLKNFDSFILMFGLIQDAFKFGYSYDITVSNLRNSNTLGAHELSFTMFMPCRSRSKSFNTISCPQF